MSRLDGVFAWFKSHRSVLGALFLGAATIAGGGGNIYDSEQLIQVAALLALIGTTLAGAGMAKSDEYHRDKQDLLKNKIDRRSTDSPIPARDLQKLVAKHPKEKE